MAALASDRLRNFRLLLWNRWTEFNETGQEARFQRPILNLCFSSRSENQDGRPGLWLAKTFLTSSLQPLNGNQRKLTGSKISTSYHVSVFGSGKQDGRPGLWLAKAFSTSSLQPLNGNQRNLTWSKISTSYQVCVLGRENKYGRPGFWLAKTFLTSSLQGKSTKLDRNQDFNVLDQVCVFHVDRKTKMAALDSDWLRHFLLLLWNR